MRRPRPRSAPIALAVSFVLTLAVAADPRARGQGQPAPGAVAPAAKIAAPAPAPPAREVPLEKAGRAAPAPIMVAPAERAVEIQAPAALQVEVLRLNKVGALGVTPTVTSKGSTTLKPGAPTPPGSIGPYLQLADGGFVAGALADSDKPGVLRWQGGQFTSPFEFPLAGVTSIHAPTPRPAPRARGAYRVELLGGDTLFGAIATLNDKEAEVDVAGFGRLHIARERIRRIDRWRDGADLLYVGPTNLESWTPRPVEAPKSAAGPVEEQPIAGGRFRAAGMVGGGVDLVLPGVAKPGGGAAVVAPPPAPRQGWREDSGELVSEQDGAPIQADVVLPARALIEFEIAWKTKPDFVLALGAGPDAESARDAFRFEVWDKAIVAVREVDNDADFAPLGKAVLGAGRLHVRAFLDQEAGRLIVLSSFGEALADLTVKPAKAQAFGGVVLENKKGDARVERLRVSRWDGHPPRIAKAGEAEPGSLERVDGAPTKGRLARFDAEAKAFVLADGDAETKVPEDEVSSLTLNAPSATPSAPDDPAKAPRVRASLQDGTRVSGSLMKVEAGQLVLEAPGVTEPLRLAAAGLSSLTVVAASASPTNEEMAEAEGKAAGKDEKGLARLVAEGVNLRGRLDDAKASGDASCLAWKPVGSHLSSPLKAGVAGRILFKNIALADPAGPSGSTTSTVAFQVNGQLVQQRAARQQVVVQRQFINGQVVVNNGQNPGAGLNGFVRGFATNEGPRAAGGTRSLFLRTGDVLPAEVTKIDETGVTFKSPVSSSTFVPNAKIKAVELAPETSSPLRLNKPKRDRLLTLPRAQQGSPPTHLVRSKNGDYLRGRVVAMNARNLEIENKLDTRTVPRERISRIIWLHADEVDPAKKPEPPKDKPEPAKPSDPALVQAVRSDGVRITFTPETVEAGALTGKSDVLGACKVPLASLDELLLGPMIQHEAVSLAYQQWRLHNAEEPKVYQDETAGAAGAGGAGGGEDRSAGMQSPLVGKEAPPFELDLLDGKKFSLASLKGEVVVLDFWATWCGPCLQAMPQVDKAVAAFKDQGVKLIAVNLQETPKEITAMMERHKLSFTVALDRNGLVAEKYNANAIPQTVIIGRDGKIARLYVGGGPRLGQQLQDALKAVLDDKPKDAPKTTPAS